MGFWLNPLNKVRGHTSSRNVHVLFYDIKHTSYTTLVIFFKMLRFFKKTVANKLLNRTTGAVETSSLSGTVITPKTVYQFTVFSSCSIICHIINFRITYRIVSRNLYCCSKMFIFALPRNAAHVFRGMLIDAEIQSGRFVP